MQTHKVCSKCKENKLASDYTTRTSAKGKVSLQSRCRKCASEAARESNKKKFEDKDVYNMYMVLYRRTPSGALSWFKQKAKKHGLPPEEVERAAQAFIATEGHCEVCGADPIAKGNKHGLYLDHCHETMTFRGLLCLQCNSMLGYGRDNAEIVRRGAEYLENHRSRV